MTAGGAQGGARGGARDGAEALLAGRQDGGSYQSPVSGDLPRRVCMKAVCPFVVFERGFLQTAI